MTPSDLVTLALAAIGAIGGIVALASKTVDWMRDRSRGDARTAGAALRLAKRTREETGRHVDRWASCEERCRELTDSLARLEERLARLEGVERENSELRARVATLEAEVRRLRAAQPLRRELSASADRRKAT